MKLLRYILDWLCLNHRFYHESLEKIRKHQEKQIFSLLDFVQSNSPFYRELLDNHRVLTLEDFKMLSVMNKTVLMTNFDDLNTAGLHLFDVMSFAGKRKISKLSWVLSKPVRYWIIKWNERQQRNFCHTACLDRKIAWRLPCTRRNFLEGSPSQDPFCP